MEQFKNELRQLLTRYPQVKSVSFDVTETITKDTQPVATAQTVPTVSPPASAGLSATLEHLKSLGGKV